MLSSCFLFLLTLTYPVSAFYPTKFRANLASHPGISHEQITENAFNFAAQLLFPQAVQASIETYGASLSKGMLAARTEISRACALADRDHDEDGWHYDGGNDAEGRKVLKGLKEEVLEALVSDDILRAREALGEVLHVVQDVIGYGAENFSSALGIHERSRASFGGYTPEDILMWDGKLTDTEYISVHSSDWLDDLLGAVGIDPRGAVEELLGALGIVSKGTFDMNMLTDDGTQTDPKRHIWAAIYALAASIRLLEALPNSVSARQVQRLFGIGLDSLIVLDPALRRSEQWSQARPLLRSSLESLISNDTKSDIRYTGVRLLSTGFGPESALPRWIPIRTPSDLDFIDDLLPVTPSVACSDVGPEILLARIQELQYGGEVTLIVAQPLREDDAAFGQIANFLSRHPVSVNIVQLQSACSSASAIDPFYKSIADLSNGLPTTDLSFQKSLRAQDVSWTPGHQLTTVFEKTGIESDEIFNLEVGIDVFTDQIVLSIFCEDCSPFYLSGYPSSPSLPDPVVLKRDDEAYQLIFTINNPSPGLWSTNISSTSIFHITVQARSSIQLVDFYFAENAGRTGHQGFFPVEGAPLADTNVVLIGELYGDVVAPRWYLVDLETDEETEVRLLPGLNATTNPGYADLHTFGVITQIPDREFFIVVRGQDSKGNSFQRVFPYVITPGYDPERTYDLGGSEAMLDCRAGLKMATSHRGNRERRQLEQQEISTTVTASATASRASFFDGVPPTASVTVQGISFVSTTVSETVTLLWPNSSASATGALSTTALNATTEAQGAPFETSSSSTGAASSYAFNSTASLNRTETIIVVSSLPPGTTINPVATTVNIISASPAAQNASASSAFNTSISLSESLASLSFTSALAASTTSTGEAVSSTDTTSSGSVAEFQVSARASVVPTASILTGPCDGAQGFNSLSSESTVAASLATESPNEVLTSTGAGSTINSAQAQAGTASLSTYSSTSSPPPASFPPNPITLTTVIVVSFPPVEPKDTLTNGQTSTTLQISPFPPTSPLSCSSTLQGQVQDTLSALPTSTVEIIKTHSTTSSTLLTKVSVTAFPGYPDDAGQSSGEGSSLATPLGSGISFPSHGGHGGAGNATETGGTGIPGGDEKGDENGVGVVQAGVIVVVVVALVGMAVLIS